jgi:hypothetical protein
MELINNQAEISRSDASNQGDKLKEIAKELFATLK